MTGSCHFCWLLIKVLFVTLNLIAADNEVTNNSYHMDKFLQLLQLFFTAASESFLSNKNLYSSMYGAVCPNFFKGLFVTFLVFKSYFLLQLLRNIKKNLTKKV